MNSAVRYRSYVSSRFFVAHQLQVTRCKAKLVETLRTRTFVHGYGTPSHSTEGKAATNSFLCTQEETDSQNTYDMVGDRQRLKF